MRGLYKTPHVHTSLLLQVLLPGPAQSELEEDSRDQRCHHWQGSWNLQATTQKLQKELGGGRHGIKQNLSSPGGREAGYYS